MAIFVGNIVGNMMINCKILGHPSCWDKASPREQAMSEASPRLWMPNMMGYLPSGYVKIAIENGNL